MSKCPRCKSWRRYLLFWGYTVTFQCNCPHCGHRDVLWEGTQESAEGALLKVGASVGQELDTVTASAFMKLLRIAA